MRPRPVVVVQLEGPEERASEGRSRTREEAAAVASAAEREIEDRLLERVDVVDVDRAGGREVALVREIRALLVLDARHELGDQEVVVGVSLSVCVRRHVHRHARDRRRDVRAVVEVEPAQVVLVRLALAGVLADQEARYGLEDVRGAVDLALGDLVGRDDPHRGRVRDADEVVHGRVEVREVVKRALPRHDDVRRRRQMQAHVSRHDAGSPDVEPAPDERREAGQPEDDVEHPGREVREEVRAVTAREGRAHGERAGARLDRHAGQRPSLVVADDTAHGGKRREERGRRRRKLLRGGRGGKG